jgi:hypothetical protein
MRERRPETSQLRGSSRRLASIWRDARDSRVADRRADAAGMVPVLWFNRRTSTLAAGSGPGCRAVNAVIAFLWRLGQISLPL